MAVKWNELSHYQRKQKSSVIKFSAECLVILLLTAAPAGCPASEHDISDTLLFISITVTCKLRDTYKRANQSKIWWNLKSTVKYKSRFLSLIGKRWRNTKSFFYWTAPNLKRRHFKVTEQLPYTAVYTALYRKHVNTHTEIHIQAHTLKWKLKTKIHTLAQALRNK